MLSKVNYILSTEIDIFDFENIEKSLLKHKVKNTVTDLLNNIYLFYPIKIYYKRNKKNNKNNKNRIIEVNFNIINKDNFHRGISKDVVLSKYFSTNDLKNSCIFFNYYFRNAYNHFYSYVDDVGEGTSNSILNRLKYEINIKKGISHNNHYDNLKDLYYSDIKNSYDLPSLQYENENDDIGFIKLTYNAKTKYLKKIVYNIKDKMMKFINDFICSSKNQQNIYWREEINVAEYWLKIFSHNI